MVSKIKKMNFLKTLSITEEKRKYFINLHKFCLNLNQKISTTLHTFSDSYNYSYFAGGAIRDALLLDIHNIKDLDLFCHLENLDYIDNYSALFDIFLHPEYEKLLDNNQEIISLISKLRDHYYPLIVKEQDIKLSYYHSNTNVAEEIKKFINNKFNFTHSTSSVAAKKLLISYFLEQHFDCNSQYNTRSKNLSTEAINNSYGVNINNLIGLIKSNVSIGNKEYDIDFILPQTSKYVQQDFDLHICQAAFPYFPKTLYKAKSDGDNRISFFYKESYQKELKELFTDDLEYILFIEENIHDDEIFFEYLASYLYISEEFIANATYKFLSINNNNINEVTNSLKKHYQNVFKKYPYPLYFTNEENIKHSVFDIIQDKKFDILLW